MPEEEVSREVFLRALGAHLRQVRTQRKGWGIREAELHGKLDRALLSRIENGKVNLGAHGLMRLCDAYGLTLEELFQGFDHRNTRQDGKSADL